jgi:hypothetical protein
VNWLREVFLEYVEAWVFDLRGNILFFIHVW